MLCRCILNVVLYTLLCVVQMYSECAVHSIVQMYSEHAVHSVVQMYFEHAVHSVVGCADLF